MLLIVVICFFGIIRKCIGVCGLILLKVSVSLFLYKILVGIDLLIILLKMVLVISFFQKMVYQNIKVINIVFSSNWQIMNGNILMWLIQFKNRKIYRYVVMNENFVLQISVFQFIVVLVFIRFFIVNKFVFRIIGIESKNEKCVVFLWFSFNIKFVVMVIFEWDVLGMSVSICVKLIMIVCLSVIDFSFCICLVFILVY